MCNKCELYWAAGFFDGEGNIRWEKVDYYYDTVYERAVFGISQVRREPLERFQRAVGGVGNLLGPYVRKGQNQQPYYQFRIQKYSDLKKVALLLVDKVSIVKQEQIKTVLEKMDAWKEKAQVYKERGLRNQSESSIIS